MPISSHGNSQFAEPRFVMDDLTSTMRFVESLERNGCYRVPKEHLENLCDELMYINASGCGYSYPFRPRSSCDRRTMYSIESVMQSTTWMVEEVSDFIITNQDGKVLKMSMTNGKLTGAFLIEIGHGAHNLGPQQVIDFLEDYVIRVPHPNDGRDYDGFKPIWFDRQKKFGPVHWF